MIKALIFDFDGVIVISEKPRFKAVKSIAKKYGIDIDDRLIDQAKGKTTQRFLEQIIEDESLVSRMITDFKAEYTENITDYVEPISFTVDFIREYQGSLPIAIASMSSRNAIQKLVKHMGIEDKITHITTRDEVTNHKPHPEIYLKTAEDLGIIPVDCLAFEDTALGVEAAISAGMLCCGVLNGENNKDDFTGQNIYSFIETKLDLFSLIKK